MLPRIWGNLHKIHSYRVSGLRESKSKEWGPGPEEQRITEDHTINFVWWKAPDNRDYYTSLYPYFPAVNWILKNAPHV